jgi:hypothetical protein
MPGDLGREHVSSVEQNDRWRGAPKSARISSADQITSNEERQADQPLDRSTGFLTRSIGLRTREETTWGQRNGLTSSLSFIHNLSNVFPPELAKTHPEYFPFVEGKRLAPPKGSAFWNPDLGR